MRRLTTKEIPLVKQRILELRQSFGCAICGIGLTVSTGCLDHDHSTGIIRGVLCRNCNGIEGKIKNLVTRGRRGMPHKDYLGKMILYWINHETDKTGLLHPVHLDEEQKRVKRNTRARKVRLIKKKG